MRPRVERSAGRHLFGTDPETYEAARPGHAGEVYEILRERCGIGPGSTVLEIGPGTGQATRRLLELGAGPVVAIEPDPELARYLGAALGDRVQIRVTALEDAALDPAAFDLAAAASSFHWVEEDAGLAKVHSALRPEGWIALWWTSFGDETRTDAFRTAVDPLFVNVPHGPSGPRQEGRPGHARDATMRLAALERAGFQDLEHDEMRWSREWDTPGIRSLYSTYSPVLSLEPEVREELLDGVARIAETEFGGRVERTLLTSLYTARKPA